MEYRILPHGVEKISIIGLGSGSIIGTEQEMWNRKKEWKRATSIFQFERRYL